MRRTQRRIAALNRYEPPARALQRLSDLLETHFLQANPKQADRSIAMDRDLGAPLVKLLEDALGHVIDEGANFGRSCRHRGPDERNTATLVRVICENGLETPRRNVIAYEIARHLNDS